mmetsp:Transcript_8647/g.21673  ORF Transcript_8647/g.21673 Transcript_8647/m.21673 type:complete len:515 (-) Transcript_8647:2584-4128(-)
MMTMMPTTKSCLRWTVVTTALLLLCKHSATEVDAYHSTYFGAGDSEEGSCDVESIGMALKRLTPMPMASSSSSFNSKSSSSMSSKWMNDNDEDEDDENYQKSKRYRPAVFLPTAGQLSSYEEQDYNNNSEDEDDDNDDYYNDQRGLRPKADSSSSSSSSSDDLGKGKRRKFRKGRGKGRNGKDGKSSKKSKRDTVNCSPVIERFSSIIAIEFIGDKAAVTNAEKDALELTLVDAYNEIQETRCDIPYFRTCEVAEIQVVRDGSSDTVFQYLFEVEGTCRGTGCSTNQQFFSDAVVPISLRRNLRDLRGSDECDCPEDPDGFGAPSTTEFGAAYFVKVQELRQALVLFNIDSSARVQEVSVTSPTTAPEPTFPPTPAPTPTDPVVTENPSTSPSESPSRTPSETPSFVPSVSFRPSVSSEPSSPPSGSSAPSESESPSNLPSLQPSEVPSEVPSEQPSFVPSSQPTDPGVEAPSLQPSESLSPSFVPSSVPSVEPSESSKPSLAPSVSPTEPGPE